MKKQNNFIQIDIDTDKIDFTDWGFAVIDWDFTRNKYSSLVNMFINDNYTGGLLSCVLYGWGATPEMAIMNSKRGLRQVHSVNIVKSLDKKFSKIYRVTPRAMDYLNKYGFDYYNITNSDIGIIKIPLTVDNYGQPVNYIIDLMNEKIIKELDILILSPRTKEKFENTIKKTLESVNKRVDRIRHNPDFSYKNRIINVTTDKNNPTNNYPYKYAACYETEKETKIYGLGATPEKALQDAMTTIESDKEYLKTILKYDIHRKFELFCSIRPLTTRAKKYLKAFGFKHKQFTYEFGAGLIKIPLTKIDNSYPVNFAIDIVNKKEFILSEMLTKITD